MADYFAMDSRQCAQELDSLRKIYEEYAAKGLKLDMSRGKPAPDQPGGLQSAQGVLVAHLLTGAHQITKVRRESIRAITATWKACRRHAAFLPIFWAHSRMR